MKKHAPGCRCCNSRVIGFSSFLPQRAYCFEENVELRPNMPISQIFQCDFFYLNAVSGMPYSEAAWENIRDWVIAGGRLWIATERQIYLELFGMWSNPPEDLDVFLDLLGSSMEWVGGQYDINCETEGGPSRVCQAGDAAIAQDVEVRMAWTAEISGGTTVLLTPTDGIPMVCAEQLGNGFVFLSGDSDIWGGCGYEQNCEFIHRLVYWNSAEIL